MGLKDDSSGEDLFFKSPRICTRCGNKTDIPLQVHFGPGDVWEEHRCPDGVIGRLRYVYPPKPPGEVPPDPLIVDTEWPIERYEPYETR